MSESSWIGPRVAGGTCRCGYWQDTYTVVSIDDKPLCGSPNRMTVEWSDGHRTTHCTSWDAKRDSIVAGPAPDSIEVTGPNVWAVRTEPGEDGLTTFTHLSGPGIADVIGARP